MTYKLQFTCDKDPNIARHYEYLFTNLFLRDVEMYFPVACSGKEHEALGRKWKEQMEAEARFQEHYDFVVVEGRRQPLICNETKEPRLLISNVAVVLDTIQMV